MLLDYTCELPVDIVIGQRRKKHQWDVARLVTVQYDSLIYDIDQC